jgi:hypothetical protein
MVRSAYCRRAAPKCGTRLTQSRDSAAATGKGHKSQRRRIDAPGTKGTDRVSRQTDAGAFAGPHVVALEQLDLQSLR